MWLLKHELEVESKTLAKLKKLRKFPQCTGRIINLESKQKHYSLKLEEFLWKESNRTHLHGGEPEFEEEEVKKKKAQWNMIKQRIMK